MELPDARDTKELFGLLLVVYSSKTNNNPRICTAWVKTLAGANIPLSKTDHPLVREFLDSRIWNGVCDSWTQLTETYIPEVYLKEN
ncbi:unnamed protein product [Lepidochelys olivacea]